MNIRNKLFLGISALILIFILMSVFFNQTFLLSFYIRETQLKLLKNARDIDSKYKGKVSEIRSGLRFQEWNSGIHIEILDPELKLLYLTMNETPPGQELMPLKPPPPEKNFRNENPPFRMEILSLLQKNKPGYYTFQNKPAPKMMISFVDLGYVLNNGDLLVLSRPLAALEESAGVANRFLILSGLLLFIIGIMAVYFFSKRFTGPIIELRDIAQAMEKLDFSHKFASSSHDEIAELGKSINSLSDQLDHSIGELKKANQKLRDDIDKERKLEEMRKDFVSSVSHELKTPLALIQGYAEGLRDGIAKKNDRDYYCNTIIEESGKMNRILQDLLNLAQYESGIFRLSFRQFDLKNLLEETMQKYTPLIYDKKIKLELLADSVVINADPSRIEQVIINFLNNAMDHCENEKRILIRIEKSGDTASFYMFNSGKPIPEDALEKIWLRFYKTDPSRSRAHGGTGLGLAVVRAILELHNASYGVRNLREGVEFWFKIDISNNNPNS